MAKRRNSGDSILGGLGLLTATIYLCIRELKRVDARLKKKK